MGHDLNHRTAWIDLLDVGAPHIAIISVMAFPLLGVQGFGKVRN
jgi:hypothetical protein